MTDYTRTSWAQALLQRLGLPQSSPNVTAIVAWETAEGGHWNNDAKYNPLNTTQEMPGATSINSVGVKAYTSWDQGLTATVQTLSNGLYGAILNALRAGNSAMSVAKAIASTPWGTGSLVEKELGFGVTDTSASSSDSGGGSSSPTKAGLNVNPLDGFGIPSAIGSSIGKDAMRVVIEGVLILGGIALVVVGLYRSVQPTVQKVAQVGATAAKVAAA